VFLHIVSKSTGTSVVKLQKFDVTSENVNIDNIRIQVISCSPRDYRVTMLLLLLLLLTLNDGGGGGDIC
jgi:hypothetical protein